MVYVDALMDHGLQLYNRHLKSCHMFADTDKELHDMALAIGLKRRHWQSGVSAGRPEGLSHYDLTEIKREMAIEQGARILDGGDLLTFMKSVRGKP